MYYIELIFKHMDIVKGSLSVLKKVSKKTHQYLKLKKVKLLVLHARTWTGTLVSPYLDGDCCLCGWVRREASSASSSSATSRINLLVEDLFDDLPLCFRLDDNGFITISYS